MDNQKASSSSSSSKKKETAMRIPNSIFVDGPVEKKLKKETIADEEVEIKTTSFDDLPNEMVMKILKNLNVKDLLACRLVNRQFTRVSSEILQSNGSVEFQFECYRNKNELRIKAKNKGSFISFKLLIKCFKDSQNFPCSRLRFDKVQKLFFEHEDWIKLITNHGERIKCLILDLGFWVDSKLVELTERLRHLLLNQLPNLQQLGLRFLSSSASSNIQLFPATSSNSGPVRLPHLKVLYLDDPSFTEQRAIVTDILDAAVNLQKIELFRDRNGSHRQFSSISFLQSLGKLPLLQCASMNVTSELSSNLQEEYPAGLDFKLKQVELTIEPAATIFLSNLFESSKDTLREIKLNSVGVLKDLEFPTFSKLTSFRISGGQFPVLSSRTVALDIFPVLHTLELDVAWAIAFPQEDSIPIIPNFQNLKITGRGIKETSIVQISSMCPNLKSLKIYGSENRALENFLEVGRAIWTHLNKLESLDVTLKCSSSGNTPSTLDSWITGISKKECKRLHHLINAKKSLEMAGSQGTIRGLEWMAVRRNISILNMKDLKNLTVCLMSAESVIETTSVSEFYALNFMDNLTYNLYLKLMI